MDSTVSILCTQLDFLDLTTIPTERGSKKIYLSYIVCLSVCLAGLCINRWSLEELVKRDPRNFIILLQQILRKTREVWLSM